VTRRRALGLGVWAACGVRAACWGVAAALTLVPALGAEPSAQRTSPVVLRAEPPNWWVAHSLNPVRVMIHGQNLGGAHVEATGGGVSAGPARVDEAGRYLFVDLQVDAGAAAGTRTLRIVTPSGAAEIGFPLLPPPPRAGRFQGLGPDDVLYLLMPDRFADGDPSNDDPPRSKGLLDREKPRYYHGGDLQGVIDHLPYIKELGATAIWLNPWYDNTDRLNFKEAYGGEPSTAYHGYHAEDFYAVEEHFGNLAKLVELTERAHQLGLKVVQDQVANHTGPYHAWLADPPTPTWFNGTEAHHLANTWQTWTLADPHASPQLQRTTLEGWFIDVLPDLNQDDPEVARYIVENALWWVGMTGVDAIRQDTLPYVPRRFWRDWTAALKREYPQLTVVGEMFDGDPSLVAFFQGGRARFDGVDSGIDSLFDYPLFFTLRRAFGEGRSLREVAVMLGHDRLYVDAGRLVTFLGLHDVPRFMNEKGATREGLQLAFTALFTLRGIPLVYYGDEIAMPGAGDPDNRRDFPGGWPQDARSAFTRSGRTAEEQAVFAHVQTLGRLRAALPPLRRGRMVNLEVTEQAWVFARVLDGPVLPAGPRPRAEDAPVEGRLAIVALNNAREAAALEVDLATLGLSGTTELVDRLGSATVTKVVDGRLHLRLEARSAAILTPGR
jgi:glycosidase